MAIDIAAESLRTATPTFWEPQSEVRFEFHRPYERPDLWQQYLDGAVDSYRQHGVEHVLELDNVRGGEGTAYFMVGIDLSDKMVAGTRFQGPLLTPEQAHVTKEWRGQFGADVVDRVLRDRLPFGAVEIKASWVDPETPQRSAVTDAVARSYIHILDLLDIRFSFGSAAVHALKRWQKNAGQLVDGLEPIPFPDDRYLTNMLWWDRETVDAHLAPEQLLSVESERFQLRRSNHGVIDVDSMTEFTYI